MNGAQAPAEGRFHRDDLAALEDLTGRSFDAVELDIARLSHRAGQPNEPDAAGLLAMLSGSGPAEPGTDSPRPLSGWLWGTGGLRIVEGPGALRYPGVIMAAELALSENTGLLLRYAGRGLWKGARVTERPEAAAPRYLADEVVLLAGNVGGASGRAAVASLRYRRYWRLEDGRAIPFLTRFVAFGG